MAHAGLLLTCLALRNVTATRSSHLVVRDYSTLRGKFVILAVHGDESMTERDDECKYVRKAWAGRVNVETPYPWFIPTNSGLRLSLVQSRGLYARWRYT
nr:hypothetical protein CFP56_37352 [Quercus suber]